MTLIRIENFNLRDTMSKIYENPAVSFIIPAYNAERTIERCIRSIVLQKKWAPKIEIIVVDDGSTDRTAEMAKALGAKVIRKSHSGVPESINIGVRNSKGDLIALVDSDIYLCEDWLKQALQEIAEGYDAINTTRVNPPPPMKSYEAFYYRTLYATFSLGSRLKKGVKIVALGDASLIRREVFETVGGFDEKFSPVGGQDVEFGIRVRKYGFKTKYSRIAKYYHSTTVQTRLRNKMKKAVLYNHGMVKAYLKHRDYMGSNLAGCWFLVMLYPLLSVLRRLLV